MKDEATTAKVTSIEERIRKRKEEEERLKEDVKKMLAPLKEEMVTIAYDKPFAAYLPTVDTFVFQLQIECARETMEEVEEALEHAAATFSTVEKSEKGFICENTGRKSGDPRLIVGFGFHAFKEKMCELGLESGRKISMSALFAQIAFSEGGFEKLFGDDGVEIRCMVHDAQDIFVTLP